MAVLVVLVVVVVDTVQTKRVNLEQQTLVAVAVETDKQKAADPQ